MLTQFEKDQDILCCFKVNPKLLAKLSRQKKLSRILSVSNELRRMGKAFWWFHANAIVLELCRTSGERVTVLICATHTHYRVRVESKVFADGGSFFEKEIEQPTGNRLLWDLVSLEILDNSFLPKVTSLHERINDL